MAILKCRIRIKLTLSSDESLWSKIEEFLTLELTARPSVISLIWKLNDLWSLLFFETSFSFFFSEVGGELRDLFFRLDIYLFLLIGKTQKFPRWIFALFFRNPRKKVRKLVWIPTWHLNTQVGIHSFKLPGYSLRFFPFYSIYWFGAFFS